MTVKLINCKTPRAAPGMRLVFKKPTVLRNTARCPCSERGTSAKTGGESKQQGLALQTDPERREEAATAAVTVVTGALSEFPGPSQGCSPAWWDLPVGEEHAF